MIKLIGTILNTILNPMGNMYDLCEPIAKLLSKIFWFSAFTGFNPNEDTIEQLDNKLEEKHEQCRQNETFRKVEDGLEHGMEFIGQLIFDCIMILCTSGLWIFWMMIRKRRNNKKNNKRA